MTGASALRVRRVDLAALEPLRAAFRDEAGCQIVRDSILGRALATPYSIELDGTLIGYGGVWTKHFPGRLMEFHLVPEHRHAATTIARELMTASGATAIEAQSNLPLMSSLVERLGGRLTVENLLFADGGVRGPSVPGCRLRPRAACEDAPDGDWVLEFEGRVVGAGGILGHYNPPYRDLHMAVKESARRRGYGSTLVAELRRLCQEQGGVPAARCDPDNVASRKTLERGGLVLCGQLVAADLRA